MTTCAICEDELATVQSMAEDIYRIDCPGCGSFEIAGSASRELAVTRLDPRSKANARGWVHENQGIRISSSDLRRLRQLDTPSVGERAEKLLVALNKYSPDIALQTALWGVDGKTQHWLAASWSANAAELQYLARQYLVQGKGWLREMGNLGSSVLFGITPGGHDYLGELRRGGHRTETGFCAMWFAPEVSAIWTNAIEPAIKDAGYNATRIDGVQHNNKIDDEILAHIRRSRFVVADFTGERGGVYFEAGFALGLGRQVIWTVREDALDKVHFDNRQYNFLVWKPDDLADFRKRLRLRIEATIGRGPL